MKNQCIEKDLSLMGLLEDNKQRKGFSIEIPALQRDYAQGRWAQKGIGKGFVNALIKALDGGDKAKGLHLDFIYGYVEGQDSKKLILIDGQQRLTTLWLLHLYLCKRLELEGQVKGSDDMKDWLGRFSYVARSGAKEFCQALLEQNFLDSEAKKPSELIYDKSPLFGGMRLLRHDPTVAAMLNMLDWIHEEVKDKNLDRLVKNLNKITFDFFDMEQFGLGEELYIKMNARGKPLSEYENLKALIEKKLKEEPKNEEDQEDVARLLERIDAEWSDYFYSDDSNSGLKDRAKLFDARGKNFLYHSALFFGLGEYFASKKDNQEENKKLKDEAKGGANQARDIFKKIEARDRTEFYRPLENLKNLKWLDRVMELFRRMHFESSLSELLGGERLEMLTNASFFDDMKHANKCYFVAILWYCKTCGARKQDADKLLDYLKVVRHLVENHPTSNSDFYLLKFFKLFEGLSDGASDIYGFMAGMGESSIEELEIYKGIFALEVRKAILIAKSRSGGDDWEGVLDRVERHVVLRGRVDFLLDFSDEDFDAKYEEYRQNPECKKRGQEVQKPTYTPNLQRFKKYADITMEILKYIPSNEDKSDYSSKRLAHLQRLWFAKGGDYGPKGWYRIYYGSAFGEDFLTRNLWHEIFVAEGDTPHFYKFLEWLCNDDGMKQLRSEKWDVESKDYASRSWWEQLLIGQGEHFAFINQGEGRIMRFDGGGRVRLSKGGKDDKKAANSRDLLCHGFYHYCRKYELDVSDYKNEDKFEVKQGGESYLFGVQYIGDKHRANIMIGDEPYLISLNDKDDIFAKFHRVLKKAGLLPNEVAK